MGGPNRDGHWQRKDYVNPCFILNRQGGFRLVHVCFLKIGKAQFCCLSPSLAYEYTDFNVSVVQVKYLQIAKKSGTYNPYRWVRYVTLANSYVARI